MLGSVVLPGLLILLLMTTIFGCFLIVRKGPDLPADTVQEPQKPIHRRFFNSPGEMMLLLIGGSAGFYLVVVVWSRLKG